MSDRQYPQLRRIKSPDDLRARCEELDIDLPLLDGDDPAEVLGSELDVGQARLANRFAILPMEGWDATTDGMPSELTRRRWRRFGRSGAGLIWGGEAIAVHPDGRANPNQLMIDDSTVGAIGSLREEIVRGHEESAAGGPSPLIGLQLTHSGRFARPLGTPAPATAWRHAVLDRRLPDGIEPAVAVMTDGDLRHLIERFAVAAVLAQQAGFDFVDIKACHGYLIHELLGARGRAGQFGGSLENRCRFLLKVIDAVTEAAPGLGVGVRLSLFDDIAYRPGPDGRGEPDLVDPQQRVFGPTQPQPFGAGASVGDIDLTEPTTLLGWLGDKGVRLLCVSAASPYYNPHLQRPAYFPPSDGYEPPEDPLVGVARLLGATRQIATAVPSMTVVGSGLSYLQEYLPSVAAAAVRHRWMDVAGLGRMALSYPDLPADVLTGRPLDPRLVCRTISDCTTAPRNGMVSGCYPLDPFYKSRPERESITKIKRGSRRAAER